MIIDKNIPIPLSPASILKSMAIGDSVLDEGRSSTTSALYMSARLAKKRWSMSFVSRQQDDGLRIWRTE
jgi:hypothetical protein